jgi:ribosomal protein L24
MKEKQTRTNSDGDIILKSRDVKVENLFLLATQKREKNLMRSNTEEEFLVLIEV